ncbi:MAG: YjbH domain-containing protein [Desulfurella sp.]|uniref:YjbH domain-containing protein n=1 Tax=Desulfurella sp. TaxID=1962857 RepID=UPI003D139D88
MKYKVFFAVLFFFIIPLNSYAFDNFLHAPNNYGVTGLMSIPTARVMKEDTYRIGVNRVSPYVHYYITLSPLKGLEINALVTEILGLIPFHSPGESGYGSYKDKSIDIKYQIEKEGKYTPAVAIGLLDPYGQSRRYSSQYIVLSKQIYPFDFTVGLGNGRLGKIPLPPTGGHFSSMQMFTHPRAWLKDSNFFWGVQFAPSDKWALMLEYDPIEYTKDTSDPAQADYFLSHPPRSHYNVGLRLNPVKWIEVDLSYQRGNQFGVNISMPFDIGKPMRPIQDHIVEYPYVDQSIGDFETRLASALSQSGFSNIRIKLENGNLWVEAQNDVYFYTPKAIKVISQVIASVKKKDKKINKVHIILSRNDVPILQFDTTKQDIDDYINDKLKTWEFLYLSKLNTNVTKNINAPEQYHRQFSYEINPSLQNFLNDPSGFFRYRFGLNGIVKYYPFKGATIVSQVDFYPFNNISTVNQPLSIPVRSDYPLYLEKKLALSRLLYNQIIKFPDDIYARGAVGLLETEYAGLDAEIAKPLFHGRVLIGISGSLVKKRSINDPFGFSHKSYAKKYYSTEFLNLRYNIPNTQMYVDLKTGRFLAGDIGTLIKVSKFINGVVLSAWYSFTNTSIFTDQYNRGYHNFGVSVSIPLRLFEGKDTKSVYSYSLEPWTRDVAQDISHYDELFDYIDRNTQLDFYRDFAR